MFTGIVEEVGSVRTLQRTGRLATLSIGASSTIEGVDIGGSIAVNGVCLTVVEKKPDGFVFEVGPETLARTALSTLGPGDPVNLERPLRFGGALGGHLVLGHIDGVGTVDAVTRVESTADHASEP
jgi:riboflavin synthase